MNFSDAVPCSDWGFELGELPQKQAVPFSVYHFRELVKSLCFIPSGGNLFGGQDLTMQPRLPSNSQSSCPNLLRAGVLGVYYDATHWHYNVCLMCVWIHMHDPWVHVCSCARRSQRNVRCLCHSLSCSLETECLVELEAQHFSYVGQQAPAIFLSSPPVLGWQAYMSTPPSFYMDAGDGSSLLLQVFSAEPPPQPYSANFDHSFKVGSAWFHYWGVPIFTLVINNYT